MYSSHPGKNDFYMDIISNQTNREKSGLHKGIGRDRKITGTGVKVLAQLKLENGTVYIFPVVSVTGYQLQRLCLVPTFLF